MPQVGKVAPFWASTAWRIGGAVAAWMLSLQEALSAMTELFAGATSYWLVLAKSGGGGAGAAGGICCPGGDGGAASWLCFLGRAI